jgi:FMN phosphatase YigB (HAD superfamily)
VPVRAVFFDVGDTLVQHWKPEPEIRALTREALLREFGEREWYDAFLKAEIAPGHRHETDEDLRQETNRWYEEWFRNSQIGLDDIEIDHFRVATTLPLDVVGSLVPGTPDALRWCKDRGLVVGLITNTLSRGDREVWTDWQRFGLADTLDHVVSSHSAGWQKPHERIFRRALELSRVPATDAVMVGDRMVQDVWGAKRLGMRAIWRRPLAGAPQETVDVEPDAIIDDLTELPAHLERWM